MIRTNALMMYAILSPDVIILKYLVMITVLVLLIHVMRVLAAYLPQFLAMTITLVPQIPVAQFMVANMTILNVMITISVQMILVTQNLVV
jgi:hypothetical protein